MYDCFCPIKDSVYRASWQHFNYCPEILLPKAEEDAKDIPHTVISNVVADFLREPQCISVPNFDKICQFEAQLLMSQQIPPSFGEVFRIG